MTRATDSSRTSASTASAGSDDGILDALIVRIEKLWRKAGDPAATPSERESCETKALSLMQRHRIESAMLDLERDDPLVELSYGEVTGRYGRILIDMLTSVAHAYDCRAFYRSFRMEYEPFVFGFRRDAERVIALTRMLMTDGMQRASRVRRATPAATYEYRRSFLYGFASAVTDRLAAARRAAASEATAEHGEAGAAANLVLVGRGEQVDRAFEHKQLRRSRRTRREVVTDGYVAGHAAGSEVSLSERQRVGRRRELPSVS